MSGQISLKPGNFPKKIKNQTVIPFLDKIHGSKRCILRCNDGGKSSTVRSVSTGGRACLVSWIRSRLGGFSRIGMYTGDFRGNKWYRLA